MPVSECALSLHAENVTQKTMLVIPRMNQTAFRKGHVKTCHEVSKDEGFTRLKNSNELLKDNNSTTLRAVLFISHSCKAQIGLTSTSM